jgi:hypothetical protein
MARYSNIRALTSRSRRGKTRTRCKYFGRSFIGRVRSVPYIWQSPQFIFTWAALLLRVDRLEQPSGRLPTSPKFAFRCARFSAPWFHPVYSSASLPRKSKHGPPPRARADTVHNRPELFASDVIWHFRRRHDHGGRVDRQSRRRGDVSISDGRPRWNIPTSIWAITRYSMTTLVA